MASTKSGYVRYRMHECVFLAVIFLLISKHTSFVLVQYHTLYVWNQRTGRCTLYGAASLEWR